MQLGNIRKVISTKALGKMTKDKLPQLVLKYLEEHPLAGDTLEGIAHWWVMCQQVSDAVEDVREAIEQLKAQGLITERKGPDGRTLYFVSKPE